MSLTPHERKLRAQIAINTRIARPDCNPRQATQAATTAYWSRYYDEVDPDRSLPTAERDRKAKAAWSRDMACAKFEKSRKKARIPSPKSRVSRP
jgi:hypothetical protein